MTPVPPRIDIYPLPADLVGAAVREILGIISQSIAARGACTIALAGGETPRSLYRSLSALGEGEAPDWSRTHLCFGDERMVPPDDPESNYGMVRDELICRIPIPAGNVHRIRGERPPAVAQEDYEREMERTLPHSGGNLDIILLGLGPDGHTASLFPGTDVVAEREKPVRAVYVPRLSAWRVTLTLPVINGARNVIFIVCGDSKKEIVRNVLESPGPRAEIPATLVAPAGHGAHWLLDAAAGALLAERKTGK
ncbi:MAG TPA: 6-phosphogluconolactonase [Bacteroidota bacterium]|nr:6-phosphogluconolactonase [Bacteroidota bacterium]